MAFLCTQQPSKEVSLTSELFRLHHVLHGVIHKSVHEYALLTLLPEKKSDPTINVKFKGDSILHVIQIHRRCGVDTLLQMSGRQ